MNKERERKNERCIYIYISKEKIHRSFLKNVLGNMSRKIQFGKLHLDNEAVTSRPAMHKVLSDNLLLFPLGPLFFLLYIRRPYSLSSENRDCHLTFKTNFSNFSLITISRLDNIFHPQKYTEIFKLIFIVEKKCLINKLKQVS